MRAQNLKEMRALVKHCLPHTKPQEKVEMYCAEIKDTEKQIWEYEEGIKENQNLLVKEKREMWRKEYTSIIKRRTESIQWMRKDISLMRTSLERLKSFSFTSRHFFREIERVRAIRGVSSVIVKNMCIYLFTDPVHIRMKKSMYNVGSMLIKIDYRSTKYDEYSITFVNLCGTVEGVPHPHISQDGFPCFGSLAKSVQNHYRNCEWPLLAQTLLVFLHQKPNNNDSYSDIRDWPKLKRG
jgi:hypothetical protein